MEGKGKKVATPLLATALLFVLIGSARADDSVSPFEAANTYGSVEPIANPAVIDTRPLRAKDLDVQEAFAQRVFECGVVDQVIDVLSSSGAIDTIDVLNASFDVGAGGFAGSTRPSFVYTVIDSGPDAASSDDIKVLTDSLGYVLSQGSAFLLDGDDTTSFDFPANYVVLNFESVPSLKVSAALFETVGRIDSELFETNTSGYTQFGRAYLSLQSAVPDAQFIAGYVQAAQEFGIEYTPIVDGEPSLFRGGAAFPGNNWTVNPEGEAYLARIPPQSHEALGVIRDSHLAITRHALRVIQRGEQGGDRSDRGLTRSLSQLPCRSGPSIMAGAGTSIDRAPQVLGHDSAGG